MTAAQTTDVATREEAQAQAPARQPQSVLEVFSSEGFKRQVATALPKSIDADQMMRIILTEVRMNPDLQKCTVPSFMGAVLKAAQSGLRPGMFGEGWILARWSTKLSSYEAQFQPGYMGLAQLAYRSRDVAEIHTAAVYKADHFKHQLGSDRKIEHVPDIEAEHHDEDIIAFYAVVKLVNGGLLMEVMPRRDVDAIRDTYGPRTKQGKLVGPWVTNYEPMGRKTVLIQTLKLAPKESERLQYALAAENDALFGSRVASAVVDVPTSAADRVAKKLGADENVDPDSGEVIDAEVDEDEQIGFDDGPPEDAQ
jgi:recombination protein RecT